LPLCLLLGMSGGLLKDPLFVELLGAFIGDGWIEKRGTALYICGSPTEDKWYYDRFLAPVFSKYFWPVEPRAFPYWGVYGLRSYRRPVVKKALDNGFCDGAKARTVSVPAEVMSSRDKDVVKAVIRGIFDTDGCVYSAKQRHFLNGKRAYQGRISICITSKSLFHQLLFLFGRIGFACCTSSTPPRRIANRNNGASYRIMINRQCDVDRFFLEVGSNNLRHVSRYLAFKKLGFVPLGSSVASRLALLDTQCF